MAPGVWKNFLPDAPPPLAGPGVVEAMTEKVKADKMPTFARGHSYGPRAGADPTTRTGMNRPPVSAKEDSTNRPSLPGPAALSLPALLSLLLIWALCWPAAAPLARPVRTLVHAPQAPTPAHRDSAEFFQELGEAWRVQVQDHPALLAASPLEGARNRLRLLWRRRAHFAVVPLREALSQMDGLPGLGAVGVLWPEVLHALTRAENARQAAIPAAQETWFFEDAAFPQTLFRPGAAANRPNAQYPALVPADLLAEALEYGSDIVLLVTAPPGAAFLAQALRADPALHLIPFEKSLLATWPRANPWMIVEPWPKEAYPSLEKPLELPAVFQVLLARKDLPAEDVLKMLASLYGVNPGAVRANPLFGLLSAERNATFQSILPFHPVAAEWLPIKTGTGQSTERTQ